MICLEFSPHLAEALEKACKQPRWKVDATGGSYPQAKRARHLATRELPCRRADVLRIKLRNTYVCSFKSRTEGCIRIQVRSSPLTGNLLMTTRVSLIFSCLRRLLALLYGINQPVALEQRAQTATIFVANPVGYCSPHPRAYAQTQAG